MIKRQFKIKTLLLLGLVCAVTTLSIGQSKSIDLEEALIIARENYAGLERDRLVVDQQNRLAATRLPLQPTQLYFSGEEFGANNQSGIHSFNVQQNFYLPKASRVQQAFYQQGAIVAEKQLALTDHELKRQVELVYYQLLYAKQEQELVAENVALYRNFLAVTTKQLESGETGRIPQLSARSHLGQAQLEQEHASEKHQIALTMFNQWLQSDTLYEAQGELLPPASSSLSDTSLQNNPHLQIIQAQQELASAEVETVSAQLLPQINSGFKLQTQSGNFPLFGYQIGVNVPLFQKAYQGRIEAAEVGVKVQEAALKAKEQELVKMVTELRYRLKHQQHILEYLTENLTPIVNEQREVNLKAYQEGEISYLEYLDGLEQVVKVKQQYLTALYQFYSLQVELDYLLGQ
ncbi:MAG: TolC family protein [Lewinella sp.]|uniref:TolC family protein n=1 Tax=Lewinella sp. TaxID=2004506 RepID=UPI003D6B46AC